MIRRSIHRFANRKPPGPPVDIQGGDDSDDNKALFPTEYFVSGVFGEEEFFRQSDHSFVLFSRTPEVKTDTEIEQDIIVHTIIGMSAVGTKVGFLYWLYQQENGLPKVDPNTDIMHCIRHDGPTEFDGVNDIGHLYLNVDWRDEGWDAIEFDCTETSAGSDADTPGNMHPNEETITSEESSDGRRLDFEYYDLDLTYEPDRS